jgi:D-glycero-D-manno-heptose 1,7-bisphosphate phosphatase
MVLQAASDLQLDLAESFFVGDKAADIECGRRAGTKTILVLTGYGSRQECQPDFTVPDFASAAALILRPVR